MLNYNNLSSHDFESLSKDILETYLGMNLRIYAPGKDGGVDIKGFNGNNIIGQSKHMMKSSPNKIMDSLKKEFEKVVKLDPKYYYVFVSRELSSKMINEIYNIFSNYMEDESHIFDLTRIDECMKNEKFRSVLHRHTKLWFFSSQVLHEVINSGIYLMNSLLLSIITKDSDFFVRTNCFWNANKILEKQGILLLTGDAGVGKTITSKILIHLYSLQGYELISESSIGIRDMFKILLENEDKKQIILLDDFVGQRYMDLNSVKVTPLQELIYYVSLNKNKKLIMNSRITVLNEARYQHFELDSSLKRIEHLKYEIDMNRISRYEKGMILFNIVKKNQVSMEYINIIEKNKFYMKIIEHQNYTPRVIDYIMLNYNSHAPRLFSRFIIDTLKDAYKVWDNEYSNKITLADRLFILVIYSLGTKPVRDDIVIEVFNQLDLSDKKALDDFDSCITRLENAFVSIMLSGNGRFLSLKNPSIYDYLDKKNITNYANIINVLKNAVYLEQFANIYDSLPDLKNIIDEIDVNIFKLKRYTNKQNIMPLFRDPYNIVFLNKIMKHEYGEYLSNPKVILNLTEHERNGLYKIWTDINMIDFYKFTTYKSVELFKEYFEFSDAPYYVDALGCFEKNFQVNKLLKKEDEDDLILVFSKKLKNYMLDSVKPIFEDIANNHSLIDNAFLSTVQVSENKFEESIDEENLKIIKENIKSALRELIENEISLSSLVFFREKIEKQINSVDLNDILTELSDQEIIDTVMNIFEYEARIDYEADHYLEDYKIEKYAKEREDKMIDNLFRSFIK